MCGFAGFLTTARVGGHEGLKAVATRMANRIAHRGPDDAGSWADEQAGVALGFRRLSIIDLSAAGKQPMVSRSGRYVIAFNGEIYNHLELRKELEKMPNALPLSEGGGARWRGLSDTETLLAGFEAWGVESTLIKSVGMFAVALWDVRQRTLHLLRDRFGEKPLYYGWTGGGADRAFVFGSELKALRSFPGFENHLCRQALVQFMRFRVIPAPRSIYQGIYKLEPGCVMTITGMPPMEAPATPLRPPSVYESLSLRRWWSLGDVVQAGAQKPITDKVVAIEMLEQRLSDAIKLQSLAADVSLGAFLSGGVDSSTIVAMMQQQSMRPIKTFTVGFQEAKFDESTHARGVAQFLGTDHAELLVTAAEVGEVITKLPTIYDEPFADSSQIPTYMVCRLASQQVKVALSGDGGDELFGGYNRYFWGPRIWAKLAWLPYSVRQSIGLAISAMPAGVWDALGHSANAMVRGGQGIAQAGDKAHKLAARLHGVRNLDGLYMNLVSEWLDPAQVVRGQGGSMVVEPPSLLNDALPMNDLDAEKNSSLRMMYRDSMTYLPDDILCKVDRAAMAVSLETRVPFLDHRVTELAWSLPHGMKISGGQGKWALRQVLYKHVPQKLIDRPKAGFGIPLGQLLCGPLRPWAESLLDQNRLILEGYFHPIPIRKKWTEHLTGQQDHSASLWVVLMFQAWLQEQ